MNAPRAGAVQVAMPQTREAIDALKSNWLSDPGSWDIEDTEGFEAHREELLAYRLDVERRAAEKQARGHEILIGKIMQRALRLLPVHATDSLNRTIAETAGSTTNILLRCVAEMVAPIEVATSASDGEHSRRIEALEEKIHKLERDLAAFHRDTIG